MTSRRWALPVVGVLVVAAGAVGLGLAMQEDDGSEAPAYAPDIDPAAFTTRIDNPYLPLLPGSRWVYQGESADGVERTEVEVTSETRRVRGVEVVVVRDTETVGGVKTEEAFDLYAQDAEGNVWYFGTETTEYEDGQPTDDAESWEAGVDGAQPGIVMRASPRVGETYRMQYAPGVEEDSAEVVGESEHVEVPFGSWDDALKVRDTDPNEPGVVHVAYHLAGIGVVLEEGTDPDGTERVELVEVVT